jgi:hypothetical protein
MTIRQLSFALILTTILSLPMVTNADDRPPTPEERQRIENTLRAAGYMTWEEIEFDDGMWEVDDARKAGDNREFDLKLDPKTFEIRVEREDR